MNWITGIRKEPIPPNALHNALHELGLSKSEIARRLDVNRRTVHRWLSGERLLKGAQAKVVRVELLKELSE